MKSKRFYVGIKDAEVQAKLENMDGRKRSLYIEKLVKENLHEDTITKSDVIALIDEKIKYITAEKADKKEGKGKFDDDVKKSILKIL